MNKKASIISLAAITVTLLSTSCSTTRVADVQSLSGEWNVTTIDGREIFAAPTAEDQTPYLAFDVVNSKVFGNASCNNLNGNLFVGEDGQIELQNIATTRMLCPDMATEEAFISALNDVRSFDITKKGDLQLKSEKGNVLINLVKRPDAISARDLEGEWQVLYLGEMDLSADTLEQYHLQFLPSDSTFVFSTGCNDISGKYVSQYVAISFENMRSTRMACPDMSVEMAATKILPTIVSFSPLSQSDTMGFYDNQGELQIVMTRYTAPASDDAAE